MIVSGCQMKRRHVIRTSESDQVHNTRGRSHTRATINPNEIELTAVAKKDLPKWIGIPVFSTATSTASQAGTCVPITCAETVQIVMTAAPQRENSLKTMVDGILRVRNVHSNRQ